MAERSGGDPAAIDWGSTRGRILLGAAELFSRRGYYGTSTRDIADAVSIRQPSLFHHFEAKHVLFATLIRLDLDPSIARVQLLLGEDPPWAAKLHCMIAGDVTAVLTQPFDARGLYADAVLGLPEFAEERARIELYHRLIEQLVEGGAAAGEFVDFEPSLVQRAITGVCFEALREQGGPGHRTDRRARRPLQAADFVLRALLADPAELPRVRRITAARLDRLVPVGAS